MSEGSENNTVQPASADRVAQLWRRVKEHRIAQWTVGYVAVAYAIQHAVILTSESYEWPNIVARVSMTLLALGLPIAMTLAWYHGNSVNRRISGGEFAIVSTLLVTSMFLFYVLVRPTVQTSASSAQAVRQASVGTQTVSAPGGISIAVLPFLNLSSDKEQEFFSDGMTEEITAVLAKVPDLRVVGRTSAFAFKGKNEDLRGIGQSLNATHLIEGSVRKAGDRVRITAQLIKADDGTHIWAEDYDRQLTDVFAIQEDIARAIATSLRIPLGLRQGKSLVSNRTQNLEAYQQYLRAKALLHGLFFEEARKILESVVASEPSFAPAWAELSVAYALLPTMDPVMHMGSIEEARRLVQTQWPKAEMAAKEAIRLDPNLAIGHMALAFTLVQRGSYVAADAVYQRALSLDGADPIVLHVYGMLLAATGHLAEAYRMREELRRQEPFIPIFNSVSAMIMRTTGDNKAALPILEASRQPGAVGTLWTNTPLAQAYAAVGRYADAADAILAIQESSLVSRQVLEQAARILRQAPAKLAAPQSGPYLGEWLGWIYLHVGAPERALEGEERRAEIGLIDFFYEVWLPEYALVRKTERFKAFMRKTGIVDYWRARGWPPQCHPTTGDDFECS